MSVNKVILVGRLGADVELQYLDGGRAKGTVNIATNETYKNKQGEFVQNTDWHKLIMWGKVAEIMKDLKKGYQIYVEGRLKHHTYENRNGQTVNVTQVLVDVFRALSKPISGDSEDQVEEKRRKAVRATKKAADVDDVDDDLPF